MYRRILAVALLASAAATPAGAVQSGGSTPGFTRTDAVVDIRNADGAVVGTLAATCLYNPKLSNGAQVGARFQVEAEVTAPSLPTPYLSVQCTVDSSWVFGPVASHTNRLIQDQDTTWTGGTPKLCVEAYAWHYATPTVAKSCHGGIGVGLGPAEMHVHTGLFEAASDAPTAVNTCTASPDRCDRAAVGLAGDLVAGATGGGQAEATVADNTVVVPLP